MKKRRERNIPLAIKRRIARRIAAAPSAIAALVSQAAALVTEVPSPETSTQALHASLTESQRQEICFAWDYRCPKRGLLRSYVANSWQVTRPRIRSDFFTTRQQHLIHDIFRGLLDSQWYPRFLKQLRDDTHGRHWGADQSIALFGVPGSGPFQFVIAGRHLTLRADGNAEGQAAFGGPIFYGHAASGNFERPQHPRNVFWPQAKAASRLFAMLDGSQRERAVLPLQPEENEIGFRGRDSSLPGIPVQAFSDDQKAELSRVLQVLLAPFRPADQNRVLECLGLRGGLDCCSLAFYEEGQISGGQWDNWRLEGPAFVWHFRGTPHVHVWVNVARDPALTVTARMWPFLFADRDPRRQMADARAAVQDPTMETC